LLANKAGGTNTITLTAPPSVLYTLSQATKTTDGANGLPVIAVPMATTVLSGIDALLSSVQMPAGVPVAAMAIDKPGAINAAIFAAEILATSDPEVAQRLTTYKEELAKSVAEKSARVKQQYAGKTG